MPDYKELARQARLKVLEMVHRAQTSHIASNFSVLDIATVLYENLKEEDEVVWSKGWAAASIYYFLAKQGKIPYEDLDKFQDEQYLGLAETTVPGVLVNGGSVGHGLSVACGIALGKKRAGEEGTVYCIMSDGELNEGSVWEAAMFAAHNDLDNLVAIVDRNGWQAMGRTDDVMNLDASGAFGGFGWSYAEADGHNHWDLEAALEVDKYRGSPHVVIADTIKGKGVSFMEDHLTYHYKNIDDETYQKAVAELV
jgi:transketolase